MIISEGFTPFFGKVEDLKDPLDNGRVRVRVFAYNTQNKGVLPTDSLRWFSTVNPNTASLKGVGESPTGYLVGSFVFGYYIDEDRMQGIVIGSIAGFEDNVNDVNELARGVSNDHIEELKDTRLKDVDSASGQTWEEPETAFAAKYPDNSVRETKSGHIIEIDDSEGAERIKIFHRSGSMVEIHPDGNIVYRAMEKYDIAYSNRRIHTGGNHDENILGNKYELIGQASIRKSTAVQQYQAPNLELGEPDFLEPSVLGNKLKDWINNELIPYINNHKHISASPGSPTTDAKSGPQGPFEAGTAEEGGAIYSKRNLNQ